MHERAPASAKKAQYKRALSQHIRRSKEISVLVGKLKIRCLIAPAQCSRRNFRILEFSNRARVDGLNLCRNIFRNQFFAFGKDFC
jgi:hypothetical protein